MNFNKTLSVAAAAAMAVSIVSVSASAATMTCSDPYAPDACLRLIVEPDKEATEGIGVFTQGKLDQTSVYGFKITLACDDVNAGIGGGCGFNSNSTGWKSMEWGNADAGKELTVAEDNTITYLQDTPVFKADDAYCQIWIQCWWGNIDADVVSIQPLDKDGNPIDYVTAIADVKAAEEAAPAEEAEAEVPAEETTAETEVEPTVEEEVEAEVEEEVEEETDEETEEETEEEAPAGDVLFDEEGVTLTQVGGEGTSNNWGQAVVMYTYNNIAEDEEPGENPFDVSLLNENSCIVVYYESDVAPELILQSWSGGNGWAKVPQNEDESAPGMAVFTYDYMTAMYESDDFSTLDAVNIGDQGAELTVNGVYVLSLTDEAAAEIEASIEETEDETADTTVEETAPAADSADTTAPKTGNAGLAAIAGVIAVAGAAAVTFKKRK
ncbi:MAG: hypothetical protein SOU50_00655 [Oscillospiraceae bacterium]|nr:hypothetical protein [Oscillospiraceae bacterium]MDY2846715.1 hypothetical protein [Oscillospiraceae bacterium]